MVPRGGISFGWSFPGPESDVGALIRSPEGGGPADAVVVAGPAAFSRASSSPVLQQVGPAEHVFGEVHRSLLGSVSLRPRCRRESQRVLGDVLELLDVEASLRGKTTGHAAVFYRMLHRLVSFDYPAPATLRELGPTGQQTPAELIDRYHLRCRPLRDLLVDYLCERQPALDYVSLKSLAHALGKRFWADIEHHHPGIDTLRLPVEVADAWKQRLKTKTKTVTTGDRRENRSRCRADQLPRKPDPGPSVLPRPGAMGHRGPGAVGSLGDTLPRPRG